MRSKAKTAAGRRNEIYQGREHFTGEMREAVTDIGAEIIARSNDKEPRTLDGLPMMERKLIGRRADVKYAQRGFEAHRSNAG